MKVDYLPCGDTGITVEFEGENLRATNTRALRLHAVLNQALPYGVTETVPTYRSVTLHYDPCRTSNAALTEYIKTILPEFAPESHSVSRRWCLPACFEGEYAPDMKSVSAQTGVPVERIIKVLTQTVQSVYMLGFAPGQPYLGDLPEDLYVPRRKEPIARVPSGAILTATAKTVIYPVENPTGWYVLGRTPIELFAPNSQAPVLLQPGDEVIFERVCASEFRDLADDAGQLRNELIARSGQ